MIYEPAPSPDGRRALIVAAALGLVELLLALLLLGLPAGGLTFLLLVLALLLLLPLAGLLWRAWLCLSLSYWIDRNAVTVAWGPLQQLIPLGQIQEIRRHVQVSGAPGPPAGASAARRWLWALLVRLAQRWPRLEAFLVYGPFLDSALALNDRTGLSLASRSPEEQLLLVTAGGAYGISPADPEAFLEALGQHHALGPTHLLEPRHYRPGLMESPLWRDWLALGLLLAGFAGALLLVGVFMVRHAGAAGRVSDALLAALPIFGLAVWAINGAWGLPIYRQQRVASLLLWSGTLVAQVAALVALLSITAG